MNRLSPVSLAYFGKVASRGDFVRGTQQGPLIQMLDQWLSQGLERLSVHPRWKQRYDQVGPSRFAFLGVRNKVALAGYLVPSVDASGRRFPFVAAGAFDVDGPSSFIAHAPMALGRLWSRLETIVQEARSADDPTALLDRAAQGGLEIDVRADAYSTSLDDFLAMQTVGALEALLQAAHPGLELRRTLLALGLLLQPVPASGVSRLDKGLSLPLPEDTLYAPFVGAFWMSLVTPFLARGDFELAVFVVRPRPGASELCVGFAGGSPLTLQAIFDGDMRAQAFVDVAAADWVDDHLDDYAIKKLSSYLMQPQLSMSQAMQTFKECFLGV